MKYKLFLSLLLASSASFAQREKIIAIYPGEYKAFHDVQLMYPSGPQECKENGGEWVSVPDADEACLVKNAADTIIINASGPRNRKTISVSIETVSTNFHSCAFDGRAVALRDGRLLASAPIEVIDENGNVKNDICNIMIDKDVNGLKAIVVESKQYACSRMCGASAGLDVYGAKKFN